MFSFIRYTQPSWQFNINPIFNGSFPSCIVDEKRCHYDFIDKRYETKSAQLFDAGYRLWNKGVLLESTQQQVAYMQQMQSPSLKDEYIFIRKYWGSAWALFALLHRLICLHNPFKEIWNFLITHSVKREELYKDSETYQAFDTYHSSLVASLPLVAVIVPTLNRYNYLKDVLLDLEVQTYKNFEVVVVDQSDHFDEEFYTNFSLKIKLIQQSDKLLWTARNKAILSTNAAYLLFFDDDSRVEKDWIEQHLKCLDFFNVSISAGVSLATIGSKVSQGYQYFRWADQFDSGNAMVKRFVFESIGLFDEQFNKQRMGDGEFGFRAHQNGIRSISNYKAARVHLKVSSGGLREMGSWDGFRPQKWFAPKPIPSVIYLYSKYLPAQFYKNAILIGIMLSNVPYKYKRSSKMLMLSVLLTVFKLPFLLIQYYRSKQVALKMLRNDTGVLLLKNRSELLELNSVLDDL